VTKKSAAAPPNRIGSETRFGRATDAVVTHAGAVEAMAATSRIRFMPGAYFSARGTTIRMAMWRCALLALAACGGGDTAPPLLLPGCTPPLPPLEGKATHYRGDGTGKCSFDAAPDRMVAALSGANYAKARWCGACLAVDGPDGRSVTVRVVDSCPGCKFGDLDLSEEAFARLAPLERGRIRIRWRVVPCAVEGPLAFHWKPTSTPAWAGIQIRNHAYPIDRVETRRSDGTYRRLYRSPDNFFVATGLGAGPYTLRVVSARGQIIDEPVVPAAGETRVGAEQFATCASDR
jgi:expansin